MGTKEILAKNIKELREDLDLLQEELAGKVGLNRPAISLIESCKREVTSVELAKLAKVFDVTVDELLSDDREEEFPSAEGTEMPTINKEKFKQVLLYILEKCGAKHNVGETVIYKLLYFADFNFYELHEKFLTGEIYRRIKHGPAPCHFNGVIEEMIKNGQVKKVVTDYYGKLQKKYIPQVKPDLSVLNGEELEVIDEVVERLSSMNATAIEYHSHNDVPYEIAEEKEVIDYETVFYRKPSYSVREYEAD